MWKQRILHVSVAIAIGILAGIFALVFLALFKGMSFSLWLAFAFFFLGGLVLSRIFPTASWMASLFLAGLPLLLSIGFFISCLRGCGEGAMALIFLPFIVATLAASSAVGFIVGSQFLFKDKHGANRE